MTRRRPKGENLICSINEKKKQKERKRTRKKKTDNMDENEATENATKKVKNDTKRERKKIDRGDTKEGTTCNQPSPLSSRVDSLSSCGRTRRRVQDHATPSTPTHTTSTPTHQEVN